MIFRGVDTTLNCSKAMSKKQKHPKRGHSTGGFDRHLTNSDFYSSSAHEPPLNDETEASNTRRVRKTERHQAVSGRRKEAMDPREKLALVAILKLAILLVLLVIGFFMLRKGIGFYEESIWMEHATAPSTSPVLEEIVPLEKFDLQDQNVRDQFGARIERWKEADRLVRSADVLLQRKIYDQAIEQCQDALRKNASHRGALERLGTLYYAKTDYIEAVNVYIRLLSIDPSSAKTQKLLIQSLAALDDDRAVKYMAEWYLDENINDVDVQRYLANALYAQEEFEAAVEAYASVLRGAPKDLKTLESQADAYMQLHRYEKALVGLEKLRQKDRENPAHYKKIVMCNAQLQQGRETAQALGRAAHLFGEKIVMGWLQSPQLDPVREDRNFKAFTDRVGGEEYRQWIEKMATSMEVGGKEPDFGPQLKMPAHELQNEELLKSRNR